MYVLGIFRTSPTTEQFGRLVAKAFTGVLGLTITVLDGIAPDAKVDHLLTPVVTYQHWVLWWSPPLSTQGPLLGVQETIDMVRSAYLESLHCHDAQSGECRGEEWCDCLCERCGLAMDEGAALNKLFPYQPAIDWGWAARETERRLRSIKEAARKTEACAADRLHDRRLGARECRWCYYQRSPRIAGQAFTLYRCRVCLDEHQHPNTAVPTLCEECADEFGLCVGCGADRELDQTRVNAKAKEQQS